MSDDNPIAYKNRIIEKLTAERDEALRARQELAERMEAENVMLSRERDDLREQLSRVEAEAREMQNTIERSWVALGTTAEEAATDPDPDVANLDDAIRVSLQYERDKVDELQTQLKAAETTCPI